MKKALSQHRVGFMHPAGHRILGASSSTSINASEFTLMVIIF